LGERGWTASLRQLYSTVHEDAWVDAKDMRGTPVAVIDYVPECRPPTNRQEGGSP
jgi:hypothetical protein